MRVSLFHDREEEVVLVMQTIGGRASDGIMGDVEFRVGPGEALGGVTYEELVELGNGEHEIPGPLSLGPRP